MAVEDTSDPDAALSVDTVGHDYPDAAAHRELAADVRAAVRTAADRDAPALPRGAGSSLAEAPV